MDKKTNIKTCKYKRDELYCDSDEYKFVKNFYETNTSTESLVSVIRKRGLVNSLLFGHFVAPDNVKLHKISENYPTTKLDEKRNNLMLFHGTNEKNVDGILNKGFINSEKGRFGKGVYMTEISSFAVLHSLKNTLSATDRSICNRFIFVNEVLESEKLQIVKYNPVDPVCLVDSKPDHKFSKHVINDRKITTDEYKQDAQGRRYRNTPDVSSFQQGNEAKFAPDVFLADESLVIPRYLIVIGFDKKVELY